MVERTVNIGLSLGADICWPICYESSLDGLKLDFEHGGDGCASTRAGDDRALQPAAAVRYDVVIDRLTHWYHTSREWIKKAIVLNDLYVYNNPWSLQSNEKHTSYCAMMRLGLPVPETWLIPPKAYDTTDDLEATLSSMPACSTSARSAARSAIPSS